MILFLIVAALLLASALGLFIFPWPSRDAVGNDDLNRAFYHARVKEIEQEEPHRRDAMLVELQRTLLADIPAVDVPPARPQSRWLLLPGALALVLLSTVIFFKTSDIGKVNTLRLAQNEMPTLMARALNPADRPLRMDEVEQLALGLRSHLQNVPDDLDAWRLLGQVGMALNNGDIAVGAFAKASRLAPQSSIIALDYAGALICTGDESARRQGEMKLHELLTKNAANLRAMLRGDNQPGLNLLEQRATRCNLLTQGIMP